MGLLQRTINATKFYKPTLARFTNKEIDFMLSNENIYLDFFASNVRRSMDRRIVEQYFNSPEGFNPGYFNMGPFQISYNFSSRIRDNTFPAANAIFNGKAKAALKEYGAPGWSFRMLYEFLCDAFNAGVPFIDTYFEKVFKTMPVYSRFLELYDDIQDDINNELYNAHFRGEDRDEKGHFIGFKDFNVWKDAVKKQRCKKMAEEIQRNIKVCLSTGRIPLRGKEGATVMPSTKKVRSRMVGLHPSRLFYASGRLIDHLKIYVEVGDDSKGAKTA